MKKNKKFAFTLVELIVSVAIMGIMLLISSDITVRLMKEALRNDIRAEVDRNVNYATETMKRNIISSGDVSICSLADNCATILDTCTGNNCVLVTSIVGSVKYFRMNTVGSVNRFVQCEDKNCTDSTKILSLIGEELIITNLTFTKSDSGFIQITFNVYDQNNIVYSQLSNTGFSVVTGAIARGK